MRTQGGLTDVCNTKLSMRFHVQLRVGDRTAETKALLDNEATHSFIDTEYARALGCRLYRLEQPAPVRNADGT